MQIKNKRRPRLRLVTQKLTPSEYEECKTFWQYAKLKGYAEDLVKNANERKESDSWFIRSLFAIGFRKGLPDYQYVVPNPKYHSLWIEMKRSDQRNEKKMPEQDDWIDRLTKKGHYATYAYGADDAIKILLDYNENKL